MVRNIKTRADLFRAYADVIDMCEGTCVSPDDCIKREGGRISKPPQFGACVDGYAFAIDILEDKPVFVGDTVYRDGEEWEVLPDPNGHGLGDGSNWSWTKPDEFAHLRGALAEGKRIAFLRDDGAWSFKITNEFGSHPASRYKIVDDDLTNTWSLHAHWNQRLNVRVTKCALTGKISADVIE